jgi:bifunctional non-homologous end joining protein LigD
MCIISGMRKDKPLRFVIQRHTRDGERPHWDLMLENGTVLETYRVCLPPEDWCDKPAEAVRIFDHPLKFLSYEGSVNKGKGRVEIADCGTYRILKRDDKRQLLEFAGNVLNGKFVLSQIKNAEWKFSHSTAGEDGPFETPGCQVRPE